MGWGPQKFIGTLLFLAVFAAASLQSSPAFARRWIVRMGGVARNANAGNYTTDGLQRMKVSACALCNAGVADPVVKAPSVESAFGHLMIHLTKHPAVFGGSKAYHKFVMEWCTSLGRISKDVSKALELVQKQKSEKWDEVEKPAKVRS